MRLPGLLVALALFLGTAIVGAEPRDDAVKLANQGFDLMEQGKYAEASELFKQAADLYYSPVIALYWAKAEARQGKLLEARDIAKTIVDKPLPDDAKPSWTGAIDDARKFLASIEARIPMLRIEVKGPGADQATITIDDEKVAASEEVPLNPGSHNVSATGPKGEAENQVVELAEGDTKTVELAFDREPVAVGPSLIGPIIAYSVGGAGLIIGAITGGIFIGKANDLKDACPNEVCPPDQEDLLDETTTLGNVATVAFVVAGLGAAVGTVLLFVPIGGDKPAASISLGPTGASFEARF